MAWISIKEYIQQFGISDSTIRRRIRAHTIEAKRIGRQWYVFKQDESHPEQPVRETSSKTENKPLTRLLGSEKIQFPTLENFKDSDSAVSEIIAFSSKALNSYLMISDRLINEHEKRIGELDSIISFQKQKIAELESYVKALESEKIAKI